MEYRHLGRSGLKVSLLSFGSWVTFGAQVNTTSAEELLGEAYDAGVNFFDNAEVYAGGQSEKIMGEAIARLGWPRHSYVVSSKFFWGIHDDVNSKNTLNRKYLLESFDKSLERFGLDHLDLVFAHRPDPSTPMEEIVWTMHELVASHKAFYWGTSEWSAEQIDDAFKVAERLHLHKPVMEQPEYNLFHRDKVETEFAPLYREHGIGLTTWSPLASGLLTGKYLNGIPEGTRATLPGYSWLKDSLADRSHDKVIMALGEIASEIECSLGQLAIAWCAANPHVSTVITGSSNSTQLRENLAAVDVVDRLDPAIMRRIEEALAL